jgi:hypothetical protein
MNHAEIALEILLNPESEIINPWDDLPNVDYGFDDNDGYRIGFDDGLQILVWRNNQWNVEDLE